jgi:endoplasmic reticulum junction formation protein lunapark
MFHCGQSQPEDYEQFLAKLSLDIQKRQTHLSEIRLRERRSTLLFSIYALALWIAYVSIWYTGLLPTLSGHPRGSGTETFVEGAPVFIGPVV